MFPASILWNYLLHHEYTNQVDFFYNMFGKFKLL